MTTRHRWALTLLVCSAVLACASGGGGGGGGGAGGGGPRSLSGTVTYDFLPAVYDPAADEGGFGSATPRPVRNAVVQAMRGRTVLGTPTSTDAAGHYALSFTDPGGDGALAVIVLAKTAGAPSIQVQDNTDGGAVWGVGAPLDASATTLDLRATSGWNGTSFDAARRTAAPFAVLDSMYTAAMAFVAVRPSVVFPALAVNWSPKNVPQAGDKTKGLISTSHFAPGENQIYILGADGADTDEYDSHVIVHEWGHFFEHNLSRSDSPGGRHVMGDVMDPRIAFGEGYGNAVAAMLLPESMYVDTNWAQGRLGGFGFDAEGPPPDDDSASGAFSEVNVMRFLYDVFDPPNEPFDAVAGGLGVVHDVLTGPQKTTKALTSIGSFVAGLKAQAGVDAAAVDALLAQYNIGPIEDAWGTGDDALAAMYTDVATLASCGTGCFQGGILLGGGYAYNTWQQNQYYVLVGDGSTMTITATSAQDVALTLYEDGRKLGTQDETTSGTETLSGPAATGKTYVVNLVGFGEAQGDYEVDLTFSSH